MKITDIINSLDLFNKTLQDDPNWEDLCAALDIQNYGFYSEDPRLRAYHVVTWYCTDSYVGMRAYFLDDEFIGISEQIGRKYNQEFKFVSKDAADKTRDYVLSLMKPKYSEPNLLDLEEEVSGYYSIGYPSQILLKFHKYGIYKDGRKVEITSFGRRNYETVLLMGKFEGSKEEEPINIRNIKFKAGACYPDARIESFNVDKNGNKI
jgi:hypothetical protein